MAKVFALGEAANQHGTDYDVVMLYQVLLGRNPENSQVIQDHRSRPFHETLRRFLFSDEFRDSVLDRIARGEKVKLHDTVPKPSPEQLSWMFSRTLLDDAQRATLRQAANWEQFFQVLCSWDGFLEPAPPPPSRPPRPAMPFKPVPKLPEQAAAPAPAPASPAPAAVADDAVGIAARFDRIEAMLKELSAQIAALQPAAPEPSPGAKEKPSSKRQAR